MLATITDRKLETAYVVFSAVMDNVNSAVVAVILHEATVVVQNFYLATFQMALKMAIGGLPGKGIIRFLGGNGMDALIFRICQGDRVFQHLRSNDIRAVTTQVVFFPFTARCVFPIA